MRTSPGMRAGCFQHCDRLQLSACAASGAHTLVYTFTALRFHIWWAFCFLLLLPLKIPTLATNFLFSKSGTYCDRPRTEGPLHLTDKHSLCIIVLTKANSGLRSLPAGLVAGKQRQRRSFTQQRRSPVRALLECYTDTFYADACCH